MILDQIMAHKRTELAAAKTRNPIASLPESGFEAPPGFRENLSRRSVSIIAEIKYCSPSRGDFPCQIEPALLAQEYVANGATAVSVLTDQRFFKGKLRFLEEIRGENPKLAVLRKDFIFDRYQVAESAAAGASAFLLITSCLNGSQLEQLIGYGRELQLEALVEVHDPWELETAISAGSTLIGVNNRNLQTFEVDLGVSFDLARRLEGETDYFLVSESGIGEGSQIRELSEAGFGAFLIGSQLMEATKPGLELRRLVREIELANVD